MKPNIVILEGQTTNPGDLSWSSIENQGILTVYDITKQKDIVARGRDASIIITNKLSIGSKELQQLPLLKLICQLATGYDNIDLDAARQYGVTVCNAVGYSTDSVAQHALALILACTNRVFEHNLFVQKGGWSKVQWSHSLFPLRELSGLTLGIYGFGKIGQKLSQYAQALGMKIIVHTRTPRPESFPSVSFVSLHSLFASSDVISLHAPLSTDNHHVVDIKMLTLLKEDAILVNTGRGALIHEEDLRTHLINHPTQTAALDVLSVEPPPEHHCLIGLDNCILTPHNAWATRQSRARLIDIVSNNIEAFLSGSPINVLT